MFLFIFINYSSNLTFWISPCDLIIFISNKYIKRGIVIISDENVTNSTDVWKYLIDTHNCMHGLFRVHKSSLWIGINILQLFLGNIYVLYMFGTFESDMKKWDRDIETWTNTRTCA